MARVLMLSLVFSPDAVSTASLMADVAHGLEARGHAVTVLTSMPHYNLLPHLLDEPTLRARRSRIYTDSFESGVRVLRVRMPLRGQRVWLRLLDYLWFHLMTSALAIFKIRQVDVVFVASPPITLGIAGCLLGKVFGASLIYDALELWPDVPIHMGLIRNGLLVRSVYWVESFVYRRAVAIICIGRTFIDTLKKRGVPAHKLHYIPAFVDAKKFGPGEKDNPFSRRLDLQDKFVVLYAGNIGLTQGLEILVEAAVSLQDDEHVRILVVGDGAGRHAFEQTMCRAGVKNLLLLPFQEWEQVANLYATADACVSPMRLGFARYTVPSKILTAMSAERVVIAGAERDTETARLLTESSSGVVVPPESAEALVEAIRQLRRCPAQMREMGRRARQWVVDFYGPEAILASYDSLVREVFGARVK